MVLEASLEAISKMRHQQKNFVLYIYSPTCPYCIEGLPIFERESKMSSFKNVYKFNAKPYADDAANQRLKSEFERLVGPHITQFPMIFLFYKSPGEYKAITMDSTNIKNKLNSIQRALS